MTQSGATSIERPVEIPKHPLWCPESGKALVYSADHSDHLHRNSAYHAELQSFEVGFSVGLEQYDETCDVTGREVGRRRLEICVEYRTCDYGDLTLGVTLAEARQLRGVIDRAIGDLERVHECASASRRGAAEWALGWTPDES
jgi:hypothetical protein